MTKRSNGIAAAFAAQDRAHREKMVAEEKAERDRAIEALGATRAAVAAHYADKEATGFNPVTKAEHYNLHPSGVECIDVIRHMNFNLGNVIKYVWRADHKDAPIQDLEKARFYLEDEISRRLSL